MWIQRFETPLNRRTSLLSKVFLTLAPFMGAGCGDEMQDIVDVQAQQSGLQDSFDGGRAPTFLDLVRKALLDQDGGVFSDMGNHGCFADRRSTSSQGDASAWHVFCARSGHEQDKYALLFLFGSGSTSEELCATLGEESELSVKFPWNSPGTAVPLKTHVQWTSRVEDLVGFVRDEILQYQTYSPATDPVVFAGHGEGGAIAHFFGLARASTENGNPDFEPDYWSRYTTVISLNAPKLTWSTVVSNHYFQALDHAGKNYKPIFIERQGDPAINIPLDWPSNEHYQRSKWRAGYDSSSQDQHPLNLYTTLDMQTAAHQLQIDPWGGEPIDDFRGGPPLPDTECPDTR